MDTNTVNQWLMNAVSIPQAYHTERYYYDRQQNELFVIKENDANLLSVISKERNSIPYSDIDIAKLTDKISKVTAESEIIEISRLKLKERIAIQIDFINAIENFKFFDDCLAAINKQDETQTFVLDELLVSNAVTYLFIDYWVEFKTEQLAYFLNEFEDNYDINLQAAQLRGRSGLKRVL